MDVEKIKQKTVVEQVMLKLKDLIASGQLKVGDRLPTEQELADTFGIGRSSIREAIKIFHHLGILSSQVAKGTFVCDRSQISSEAITWSILLGENELYDIIELREVIELRSITSLIERSQSDPEATRKVVDELEQNLAQMKKAATINSVSDFLPCDYRFHEIIIEGGGNALFTAIYHTLRSFMLKEIEQSVLPGNLEKNYGEHRVIVEAFKKGDPEKTIEVYRKHIQSIKRNLMERIPPKS